MKISANFLFFGIAAAVSLLALCIGILLLPNSADTAAAPQNSEEPYYLLGSYEGKIALYCPPADVPKQIYDIYISLLPEKDREKLKNGIPVSGQDELERLLRDFDS